MSNDLPHDLDPSVAHPARRYNYWLGGKDHFAADRESGDAIERVFPHIRTAARENRLFLQRAVRYLAARGIRQFLDIGTGLPTVDNTHEVAQAVDPTARIVYVDNDPIVLVHARALLTSHPSGQTAYIHADLRRPQDILTEPALTGTLDLSQPVGLLLIAILHFLPDTAQAHAAVTTLTDALAPGSYLAASHATADLLPSETTDQLTAGTVTGSGDFTARTAGEFRRFFDGLELVPPGIVVASDWHRNPDTDPPPAQDVSVYAGVARKW